MSPISIAITAEACAVLVMFLSAALIINGAAIVDALTGILQ